MRESSAKELVARALYVPRGDKGTWYVSNWPIAATLTKGAKSVRRCEAKVRGEINAFQCSRAASREREGHHFCGVCDPIAKNERAIQRAEKSAKADSYRRAAWARNDAIDAAKKKIVKVARDVIRQRATFEELEAAVAALDKVEAAT